MPRGTVRKYDFVKGGKIIHSGHTKDLERREQEHRRRWGGGRIRQVGRATTLKAARDWERTKRRAITRRRGR